LAPKDGFEHHVDEAKMIKCAGHYANKENRTYKLLHKGVYSPEAR